MASNPILLRDNWVSDVRDLFCAENQIKVAQGKIYRYEAPLWKAYDLDEARRLTSHYLDNNQFMRPGSRGAVPVINSKKERTELVYSIWDDNNQHDRAFFADAPRGFATRNAFIRVDRGGIHREPLGPEHRAVAALDYDLPDGEVGPPEAYLESLGRIFGVHPDGLKKIEAFREFLGACRIGVATDFERAIIMPGGGSNGKSTLTMGGRDALFRPEECRSILPNFLNQEYYMMMLRDVRLNLVTELPKEQINCTERFKQTISGEDITGRPIREMPVTFSPIAGHIYCCNNFPKLTDNSQGMWRRLMVLRSDAKFEKSSGLRSDIVEVYRQEAPKILMWALQGAINLLRRGDYDLPQGHIDEEKQWRGTNDKALQFVTNCTHGVGSGYTQASFAYNRYDVWHQGMHFSHHDKLDNGAFGSALAHIPGFDNSKRNAKGKVYNFKMKPQAEWLDFHNSSHEGDVREEDLL